jgi:hypothetical protein
MVLILLASVARADDAAEALGHFKAGKQAFRSGELAEKLGQRDEAIAKYRQAVDELKKAYELQPQPVMLWGLGEAYRALGEIEPALEAYRHYLAAATPAQKPNFRAQAQAHIERLERAHAARSAAAAPPRSVTPPDSGSVAASSPVTASRPPQPTTAPAVNSPPPSAPPRWTQTELVPRRQRSAGVAVLTLLGAGLACGITGAAIFGHSTSINPDEAGLSVGRRDQLVQQVQAEQTSGVVLLGIGGAALVGSAAALGVWASRRRPVTVTAAASATAIAVSFRSEL